jgi:integrase
MGKIKVRYLVVKRQKGHPLFYWQPNRTLRVAGWLPRRIAALTNDIIDAITEAEQLNAQVDAWRSGVEKVAAPPGSLPALIRLYGADPKFTHLRPRTQQAYGYYLRDIEAWSERAGHPPMATIERKDVKAFARSMGKTPEMTRRVIKVLRILFAFAVDEGELPSNHGNPAVNMGLKGNPPRHQVWTEEQITAVMEAAATAGRPSIGLAVALAYNLGQRENDILRMTWSQFNGTTIRLRQSKTGVLLDVPCTQQLVRALSETTRTGTLMVMKEERVQKPGRGRKALPAMRYTQCVFTRDFREIARAAGIPDDMQFRDLRRTAVVRLAEAGCSVPEIAAISGHNINQTAQILEVYCPRNTRMAGHAITKLEDYRRTLEQRKLEDLG